MSPLSPLPPLAEPNFTCAPCGFDYPTMSVATCLELLGGLPDRVRAAVSGVPEDRLRHRPAEGVWSIVEYVCHLRDVYATYTIRLHRTRTEDEPRLEPMFNDLRARRFRYNELALPPVIEQLAANVAGFSEEIARVRADQWQRTATRLPHERRDALWLVRQATHEGEHHLRDITG